MHEDNSHVQLTLITTCDNATHPFDLNDPREEGNDDFELQDEEELSDSNPEIHQDETSHMMKNLAERQRQCIYEDFDRNKGKLKINNKSLIVANYNVNVHTAKRV